MEYRRRVPRQHVGWLGQYIVEAEPGSGWTDCEVVDISVLGVGLELFGSHTTDLVGQRLVVEVRTPVGTSISIRMVGDVRNMGPGRMGGARVGMEFVGLTETERSILDTLALMQVAW
ncbi:MAG TPA: PilZ domain-containing protein [Acidimicrobiales bacterium]|jgi:hypothetical protein